MTYLEGPECKITISGNIVHTCCESRESFLKTPTFFGRNVEGLMSKDSEEMSTKMPGGRENDRQFFHSEFRRQTSSNLLKLAQLHSVTGIH